MERLLAFVETHNAILTADLQSEFGVEIAKWLTDNDVRVLEKLKEICRTKSVADKQVILSDFRHDREFTAHLNDPTFQFQTRPAKTDPLRTWLVKFYEQLKNTGFHPLICGHHPTDFRDIHWWELFNKENPKRTMCVTCDGMMINRKTIEHYLPKSEYPALSIHPSNLVPMCDKCNNGKDNDDPLNGRNITEIFLPYRDIISQVIDLDFSSTVGGAEIITIRPTGSAPQLTTQVSHYSTVYQIPKRWNDGLNEIASLAIVRLKERLRVLRDEGIPVDRAKFYSVIQRTVVQMEEDWGSYPYCYPATKWLLWAKDNKFDILCTEFGIN